jgi:DNA-binding LacI/PurR family transcriptional regulator
MNSRPTMSDVAALAGVSKATVSLVISDRASSIKISEQTRQKVLTAAQQLGYSVNVIARSMSAQQTRTLGLVTYDFVEYGPAVVLAGAQEAARAHDYFLMVSSIERDLSALADQVAKLDSWRVDGIFIAVAAVGDWHRQLFQGLQLRIPVVCLEGSALDPAINAVGIDNVRGGALGVELLLALGHRRIAVITGPHQWLAARDRLAGWRQALAAANLPAPETAVAEGDWTTPGGYVAAQRLLAQNPGLTAIVAHNDYMALGAIRAVRELGLSVPADMSVVGYDDIPPAPYLDPPLTTVRQNLAELGKLAVALLIEAGEKPGHVRQVTVSPELVTRGSSASPKGA